MKSLTKFIESNNIAEDLDDEDLRRISEQVDVGYKADLDSSAEWLSDVKRVEELAILMSKKKSYPFPNAANIKFPIITKAVFEFSSRTYPEIVKDGQIVKSKVIGADYTGEKEKKARLCADYMNWQLYWENDDWELELDRLLTRLALIGFICKKTYYDPIREVIKSEVCEPEDLIINSDVKSIEDAPRITHILHVKLNDLIEGSRAGVYCEEVVDKLIEQYEEDDLNPTIDLLEQHTTLDLDEDSYEEPYIITTVKDSSEILRIVARYDEKGIKKKNEEVAYIIPRQHFTDFHFLVSPKGKFQSVGFGILLLHINEAINTVLNQLVDAGTLANLQGGYKDSRLKDMKTGNSDHNPGEFKNIKIMGGLTLKEGILPVDYKEPSSVLYQLLSLLIEAARDLSSSSDIMTGNSSPENSKTGATQALIAEGVKIHNSINKRIYRSLGNEFYKIFSLNGVYLDPEKASKVLDEPISIEDFDQEAVDILPVADPNLASVTKQAGEIAILQAVMGLPGVDPLKVSMRIIKKVVTEKPEEIMMDPNQEQPPNPEVIKIQADIQAKSDELKLKGDQLEVEKQKVQAELYKIQCECMKLKADAILSIAKAESLEAGDQTQLYMKQLDMLSQNIENQMRMTEMGQEQSMMDQEQMHDFMMRDKEMQHEKEIIKQTPDAPKSE